MGELCALAGRRQSLVSYHLRELRDGGLVSMRRSAADGRDTYYVLDIARFGELLRSAGVALHPGLGSSRHRRARSRDGAARVLFLCTGNSARSQIAEALAEQMSGGNVEARSAGSHPKPLHPNAVRVMRERGIEIGGKRTNHLDEFSRRALRLRDQPVRSRARSLPRIPNASRARPWSMPDPARGPEPTSATLPAFERTAAELATRIGFLIGRSTPHQHPGGHRMPDELVNVRYMVDDVEEAIDFYTSHSTSRITNRGEPAFADVMRGNLRLLLSGATSSAGRPMPDGRKPGPGGWNRIHFIVDDIAAEVKRLRALGCTFRNEILGGPGGKQILLEDPSGNPSSCSSPPASDQSSSEPDCERSANRCRPR